MCRHLQETDRILSESFNVSFVAGVEKDGALFSCIPVRVVDQDPLLEGTLVHEPKMIDLEINKSSTGLKWVHFFMLALLSRAFFDHHLWYIEGIAYIDGSRAVCRISLSF